jgi:hypothetical protein
MRDIEFAYATDPDSGHMRFRVPLPLTVSDGGGLAAADGQMGCLMKLYRDWRLCGDDAWLRSLWPHARKALEFCWTPGGWDADRDGVMEGCQHNTMDVEYYGPNPQMGTWYLGAPRLRGDGASPGRAASRTSAAACSRTAAAFWMRRSLTGNTTSTTFSRPRPPTPSRRACARTWAPRSRRPRPAAWAGCLIVQLVGQYMAHVCGLGYLLRPENVRATLDAVMRYTSRPDLWDHFQPSADVRPRGRGAMLMASYPRGRRPARPFPTTTR